MDWKQIAVNTVTALLVAVLSGILVWVFTRTPISKEGLVYTINKSGGFSGLQGKDISIYKIAVANRGNQKAENVSISISRGGVLDKFQVSFRRPKPEGAKLNKQASATYISIPSFLPTDRSFISALYVGGAGEPIVSIRSNNGVGERIFPEEAGSSLLSNPWRFFGFLLVFAVGVVGSRWLSASLVTVFNPRFLISDRNNAAFLLIHSGLFGLAKDVLESALRSGNSGPIVLSNYAVAHSLLGDQQESGRLISSAFDWATTKHEKAVVYFNSFIYRHNIGDIAGSKDDLKKSAQLSDSIKVYCARSFLVKNIMISDDEYTKIIT